MVKLNPAYIITVVSCQEYKTMTKYTELELREVMFYMDFKTVLEAREYMENNDAELSIQNETEFRPGNM